MSGALQRMALPQSASVHHWCSARLQSAEGVSLATRFTDFSGAAHHCARIGTAVTIVSYGGGDIWFNFGEGAGVEGISVTGTTPPTGTYTFIARLRRSAAGNWTGRYLNINGDSAAAFPFQFGCYNNYDNWDGASSAPSLCMFQGGTDYSFGSTTDIAGWADGAAHWVAVSFNSGTGTLRLYLDNSATPAATFTSVAASTAAGTMQWFSFNGNSFNHEVSDVALWTGVVLSGAEIAAALAEFAGFAPVPITASQRIARNLYPRRTRRAA